MKIELEVPELKGKSFSKHDLEMLIAVKFCESGVLSTSYAAKMLGIHRIAFIKEMHKYGKSMYEIAAEYTDPEKEFANARGYAI